MRTERSRVWRGVIVFLCLSMSVATVALAVLGDVNNDGFVNSTDVQQILESVIGTRTFTPTQAADADVDGDGDVDVADAQMVGQFAAGNLTQFPPRLPQNSGPIAVTRDGAMAGVVNPDSGTVTFLETTGDTVLAEVAVGREPAGIAFSRDGAKAYVTVSRDAVVKVVDTTDFDVTAQIPVGVEPFGVVVNFRGDRAYVSNMSSSTISVINLATQMVVGTASVGPKPQGMAVTGDSSRIFVAHLDGGQVSSIDAATLAVTSIPIPEISFDPLNPTTPAGRTNRMKGIAIHPTLARAWVPHILSNSANTIETLFNTSIFPAISVINTSTSTNVPAERMTLFSGLSTIISNPETAAFSPNGAKVYVVSAASNDLTVMNMSTRQETSIIRDVGDNPRGIAVLPDGSKAYIFNRLSPAVSVVDLVAETLDMTVQVSTDPLPVKIANGRRLFFTSALPEVAQDRFFGCESCHFDGRDDGQTWFFTNGPRQTLTLAGGTLNTGLLHHNGDRKNVQDFAFTFTRLQNGTGVTEDQLDDLAEFTNTTIRFLENPFLSPDGGRTAAGRRGRRVFRDPVVACASCHMGAFLTDATGHTDPAAPVLHDVGTFVAGVGTQDATDKTRDQEGLAAGTVRPAGSFESTSLLSLLSTPPFLHDGRSLTLLQTLTTHNPANLHGVTSGLTTQQRQDLVAYMQELDLPSTRIEVTRPADATRVVSLPLVAGRALPEIQSVSVFVNGAGPIAAVVGGGTFSAVVPPGMVPGLAPGQLFEIKVVGSTAAGEPGRDDVEVEANFGGTASIATSIVDASPALIVSNGVSTAVVTVTPRDGASSPVGTGLTVIVQATAGSVGPVTDVGDGTYRATLTSSTSATISTITARLSSGSNFTDTAQVRFAAGSVDAATSSVDVLPASLEANGFANASLTVTPRDAFGNSLGAGQTVAVGTNRGSVGPAVDQGDGTYLSVYTASATTGPATVTATVNGVPLAAAPVITLVADVTAPPLADLSRITFATPSGGISLITGGGGSVEPLATVRATNTTTTVFAQTAANSTGTFSVSLAVTSNDTVCFKVTDIAGNMSGTTCKIPFPVSVPKVRGFLRTALSGGGFGPVAGALVELDVADLTDPCAPGFTPLFIGGVYLTNVTAADGSFEIVLPPGFVPDPDLAVVSGPDGDMNGSVDTVDIHAMVNDITRSVILDDISNNLVFMICFNDILLDLGSPYPESNFTPAERTAIDGTTRAATAEKVYFGLDPLQVIADDIFFETDGPRDALDTIAYETFLEAAESAGPPDPLVFIQGQVTVPGASGPVPLAGVLVELSTLSINPLLVAPIAGASGVTDATGHYALRLPGFVSPASTTVALVFGDLQYNGAGVPGVFNSAVNKFSIGAFVTSKTAPANVDLAGRVAMSLIQIPAVPIANFNPIEVDQLVALVRTRLIAAPPVLTNKSLEQVFLDAFNAMFLDPQVITMLQDIDDPETGGGNVTASPTTMQANGFAVSTITVEPLDAGSQRVGSGLLVELITTSGTITTPAIDLRDGLYRAFLTAPTTTGTATVTATVEGIELAQKPTVTLTADTTAPAAPVASRIVITSVGGNASTLLGLPGATEPLCQVTVVNSTQSSTVSVPAARDGSFRADITGATGNSLLVRCSDAAGNTSANTPMTIGAGAALPSIGNAACVPGGVTPDITSLSQSALGVAIPAGFTLLKGFRLDLDGATATCPLDVVIQSSIAVPAGNQIVLAQTIKVEGVTQLRVVSEGQAVGGVLFPRLQAGMPGVIQAGDYAYLSSTNPIAFAGGTVAGSRGPIRGVLMSLGGSTFADLTRADGSYLLAGPLGAAPMVGAKLVSHAAPQQITVRLPYAGALIDCDFTLSTRADTSFAFTGRFVTTGQNTRRLALHPSGKRLYAALNDVGDLSIRDSLTLGQISLVDDTQSLADLAFTPNGFEAFIGYFNRVRDFTVSIEEPGLLLSNVGFPKDLAVTPNGDLALVASSLDGGSADANPDAVFLIDTFTNLLQTPAISVASNPEAIVVNRAGTRAYVIHKSPGALTVINLSTRAVVRQNALTGTPADVVVSPNGNEVYVADVTANTVRVVDAVLAEDAIVGNEFLATIAVGAAPGALALAPGGTTLLVAEQQDDTLGAISTSSRTVTGVWATVDLPADVEIQPDGKTAYVLDPLTRKGILEIPLATSDTVAPVVLDAGPQDRVGSVLQDSPVEIVFSERMNEATLVAGNVEIRDAANNPLAGTLATAGDGVSVVFTPGVGVRYALNSTVKAVLGAAVADAAGNLLGAPVEKTVPTFTMQLPSVALLSVDLSAAGVKVNGSAGAVHPLSSVEVTNLTSSQIFRSNAAADGSFTVSVVGLDNDGYEMVTSLFGGRARTNPIPVPVSFTISPANPALISYQPGPAGTLLAVGAPGAVDVQSSKVTIRNLTTLKNFVPSVINPDGSFSVGIFAASGHSLDLISEILGAITLAPVPLTIPALPIPVLDFLTPDRFIFGDPVILTIVGEQFGTVPANIRLVVAGVVRTDFTLETVDNLPGKQAIVVPLAVGSDSGSATVTVRGQASNSLSYVSRTRANTTPFAEEVMAASVLGNRNAALGASDGVGTDLGAGGSITLRIGSTVEDGPGNDLQVFETTADGEDCYQVKVSAASAGPFDLLGTFCGTAFVNLNGHQAIRFVQIVDANDGGLAAQIDAVFAIRVRLVVTVLEIPGGGSLLAAAAWDPYALPPDLAGMNGQSAPVTGMAMPAGAGVGGLDLSKGPYVPNVTANITPGDTATCVCGVAGLGVTISPPPQGGGGYGGGCSDTISWVLAGPGMISPASGGTTTYTATNMSGSSNVTVTVTRSGNCSSTGGDSDTVKVDVVKVDSLTMAPGTEFDDMDANADTKSFWHKHETMGDVTFTALPSPALADTALPSCWSLTGGTGTNKLTRTVTKMTPAETTIMAVAGCSSKTTKAQIVQADLVLHKPKVIDPAETEIPDMNELTVGTQTFVNLDNDDNDAMFDTGTTDVAVAGEDELVKVKLRLSPNTFTTGNVKLEATSGAANIKVWKMANKGTEYMLGANIPMTDLTTNGTWKEITLYVEGITAHTAQKGTVLKMSYDERPMVEDEGALTIIGIDLITWKGKNNSVSDNNTLDADANWPSGLTPASLRVFPDARIVGGAIEANARDKVDVEVKLSVTPIEPVDIYLDSFDVDDPTAAAVPVDNEASNEDNRGTAPARSGMFTGEVGGVLKKSFTAQTETVEFQVAMQPGDNFRIVGNGDKDLLTALVNNDSTGMNNADKLRVVHPMVMGALTDQEVREANKYASDVLTVWRLVHVEIDSMGAVPTANNTTSGVMNNFVGSGTALTRLMTATALGDGSTDLDSAASPCPTDPPSPLPGRFEKGILEIGTGATKKTINPITGNGTNRLDFPATSIAGLAFSAEDDDFFGNGTMSGTITEVTKSGANFVWTLNITAHNETPIDWPDFVGGDITVGGGATMSIAAVNAGAMQVTSSSLDIPFSVKDDDTFYADIPAPDTSAMVARYAPAYLRVLFDTGGDNSAIAFEQNTTNYLTTLNANKLAGRATIARYWHVVVLGAYQGRPIDPSGRDNDPDYEGTFRAHALQGSNGVIIYQEMTRDWIATTTTDCAGASIGGGGVDPAAAGRDSRAQEILDHEVGHLFNLDHPDGIVTVADPSGDVMAPSCCPPDSPAVGTRGASHFGQISLDKIRSATLGPAQY